MIIIILISCSSNCSGSGSGSGINSIVCAYISMQCSLSVLQFNFITLYMYKNVNIQDNLLSCLFLCVTAMKLEDCTPTSLCR